MRWWAAIRLYEPRILLNRFDVDPGSDARELLVTLSYRVALTGNRRRSWRACPWGPADADPLPALDDRGFDDLVADLVRRIPAHTPERTNPREGDPAAR